MTNLNATNHSLLNYTMTETQLQKVFARPLAELRAWARARDITDTSVRGIYDHYLPAKCCAGCGTPTNWGQDIRAYREFCSLACVSASKTIVARRRATCKTRYGVEDANHSPAIARKKLRTFRRNYGVDNPSQVESVKAKKTATMQANFGASHWTQNESAWASKGTPFTSAALEKAKQTCMKKYGVDNPWKDAGIQEKIQIAHRLKYGMNPGGIFNGYKRYVLTDKFGKRHIVMGYERHAIDYFSKLKSVVRLVSKATKLPRYRYKDKDGKQRTYHPDLMVHTTSTVHVIEVKSEWTLNLDLDRNIRKWRVATRSCLRNDRTFWVMVFAANGTYVRVKNPTCLQDLLDAEFPVSHPQR